MKKILSLLVSAALLAANLSPAGFAARKGDASMTQSAMTVTNLKTDDLINPIGIDSPSPVFSWTLADPDTRGQKQTAYRIRVADSAQKLASADNVWDSGKIASDRTTYVDYDGEPLSPMTRYYWNVTAWDKDDVPVTSETAFFETGLMDSGWSGAKWIGRSEITATDAYSDLTVFTVEMAYTLTQGAASLLLGAEDDKNFTMWQISAFDWHNDYRLRPQTCTNGTFSEMSGAILEATRENVGNPMTLRVEVSNGTVKTFHNGTLKDTRTVEGLKLGYVGFRRSGAEAFTVESLKITGASGNTVFESDFAKGNNGFAGAKTADGKLVFDSTLSGSVFLRTSAVSASAESAPMLRGTFTTAPGKTVAAARLYITSAGVYRAYINGRDVTDSTLNPGMTAYDDRILYQTFDVTSLVREGENAVGAYLGHGWWNRALRNFGPDLYLYAKLVVTYTDGSSDVTVTDDSWKFCRYGPILDDDLFNGFKYDATVEQALDGWNEPGYDDSAWESVGVSTPDRFIRNGKTPSVVAQNIPLIRNTVTLPALSVDEPKSGVYVYDFGQNIAGVVRVSFKAPRGTTVKLRHAEILNTENMVNPDDEPGMLFTRNLPRAEATDTYVCKGDPDGETFEPFFTYHGFRYVEITGLAAAPAPEDVTALLLMTDLAPTGNFTCSEALINQLYSNSLWSARDNFMSVPTDCPQRGERFGWTGDAQIFARTGSYMMDVNAFYRKYADDIRDTSTDNRIIADVAPASVGDGWYGSGSRKGATNGFGDAVAIIPYQIYMQYGNKRILEENYETMCNWMDYLVSTSTDYIRDESWTGDWMAVGEPKTPVAVTDTAYCAYVAHLIAKIAGILGKNDDAAAYTDLYNAYRTAWRGNFLEEDGCTTKCGTQTSYVLGLNFGLFDEDEKAAAAKHLVENIRSWDWHLSTGFLGYSFLNPVLTDNGYGAAAYKLLGQTTYPSSLYSVTMGATSIWESWYVMRGLENGMISVNEESHNHFSYGSVSEWLFRYMLGIDRDETTPGFRHFLLRPVPGGSVTSASGSYDAIAGRIESGWTLDKTTGAFTYTATVPAGTTATLRLPVRDAQTAVLESGIPAAAAEGVTDTGFADGCHTYELESGRYTFTTTVGDGYTFACARFANPQNVDASVTVDTKTLTAFPASAVSDGKTFTAAVTCEEDGYAFSHFETADGARLPADTVFSGDNDLALVFAYTGADDGVAGRKTVAIPAADGVNVTVNGEAVALPYTDSFEKGELVTVETAVTAFDKAFAGLGGVRGVGNTVYLRPMCDMTLPVSLKDVTNRKGYDLFFDFTDTIGLWQGMNAGVSHTPGFMRFEATLTSGGSYDPRTYYNFTENASSVTRGAYLPAADYDELIVGFIGDKIAGDSTPIMYISTEEAPSYTKPVRGRRATAAVTADMADGKTLHEIRFSLADWSAWTGNIRQIYLDIVDNVDCDLRVDYIRLKHRDLRLTVKTSETDPGTVYTCIPGSFVDLAALPVEEGFLGYTETPDGKDFITGLTLTEDTVIYARYDGVPVKKAVVWDFEDNTAQGWIQENAAGMAVENGVLNLTLPTDVTDTHILKSGLSLPAASYRYVVVSMRHNAPVGYWGYRPLEVFFRRPGDSWAQKYSANANLQTLSDDFRTYVVDMKDCRYWTDTVTHLRIDPIETKSVSGAVFTVGIDEIRVCEEALLSLDPGYEGGTVVTHNLPALTAVNIKDFTTPVRPGYTFLGWTDGRSDTPLTAVTMDRDVTLTALWQKTVPSVTLSDVTVTADPAGQPATLAVASFDASGRLQSAVFRPIEDRLDAPLASIGADPFAAHTVKAFLLADDAGAVTPLCENAVHDPDAAAWADRPAVYDETYGELVYYNDFTHAPCGEADLALLDAGAVTTVGGRSAAKALSANCPSRKGGEMTAGIEIVSADGMGKRFRYRDGTPIEGKMTVVFTAYNDNSGSFRMYNVSDDTVFGYDVWLGNFLDWSGGKPDAGAWTTWASKPFTVGDSLGRVGVRAGKLNVNIYFASVAVYVKKPAAVTLTDENGLNGEQHFFTGETFVFPALHGDRVVRYWTDGTQTYAAGEEVPGGTAGGRRFAVEAYADLSALEGEHVFFIGDSITEGAYGTIPAGDANVRPQNYPYFFGLYTGAAVHNYGKSGYTPKMYYDHELLQIDFAAAPAAVIIMLGTNEGLTDTLEADTQADNYTGYADTQTGSYAKIIEYIQEKTAGQTKIILMTIPVTTRRSSDHLTTTNKVIREAAAKYGLNVIETPHCGITYDNLRTYMPLDELHPGLAGYRLLAAYVAGQTALLAD